MYRFEIIRIEPVFPHDKHVVVEMLFQHPGTFYKSQLFLKLPSSQGLQIGDVWELRPQAKAEAA